MVVGRVERQSWLEWPLTARAPRKSNARRLCHESHPASSCRSCAHRSRTPCKNVQYLWLCCACRLRLCFVVQLWCLVFGKVHVASSEVDRFYEGFWRFWQHGAKICRLRRAEHAACAAIVRTHPTGVGVSQHSWRRRGSTPRWVPFGGCGSRHVRR